jgi:hypothetical protein
VQIKTDRKILAIAILVVAFAAAYFLLTFNRTFNPSDEGLLLYNFQLTAQGQVPHADFYDAYGPGIYWVGAALFKLFGTKIIVIRVFVVLLKALMALLVFLIARRILSPIFAFLGAFLFILNWGDPLIVSTNVLYAGHFNQFLALLGVLLMLFYLHCGRRRWLFGVSACIGLSILFKLHVPVIDLIGFSLLLCLKEQADDPDIFADHTSFACPGPQVLQLMRALKLLGIFGVLLFYIVYLTGEHLSLPSFFLFLLPICLIFLHILCSEFRILRAMREDTATINWKRLELLYKEIAILLFGPLVSILFIAGFYSVTGGLPDLLHDILVLPTYIKYHHMMPDQKIIMIMAACIVFVALAAIEVGKRIERRSEIARLLFVGAILLLLILPLFAALRTQVPYNFWHRVATHVLLPVPVIIGVCLFIFRRPGDDIKKSRSLGLILIFASQSLLLMSLRSDETHIVVYSTVIFVAIAFVLQELHQAIKRLLPKRRPLAAGFAVAACLAAMSIPCLWSVKILHIPTYDENTVDLREDKNVLSYPMLIPNAPRARGLKLPVWSSFTPPLQHPMSRDMSNVADFIREHTTPEEKIFLTCGDQIIYFLSERQSALQKENYFIYLSNMGFIDATNTGRVSDDEVLAALAATMPRFIVETPKGLETILFSLTWPRTNAFISNSYEIDTILGEYHILRQRGSLPSSLPPSL